MARHGLLKPRWQGTVYAWVQRYRAEGRDGLKIKPGRGRVVLFQDEFSYARRPTLAPSKQGAVTTSRWRNWATAATRSGASWRR